MPAVLCLCHCFTCAHRNTSYLLLYLPLRGCQLIQNAAKWQRRHSFFVLSSSLPWSLLLLLPLTC